MSVLKLSMSIFYCNFFCCFSKNVVVGKVIYFVTRDHRLWTPNEAFFHRNPKLLGLGRQIGQIGRTISTHFGTVSPLSIISTKNQAFISTSQIFIWDMDLNLGCKELGIQPLCVRSLFSQVSNRRVFPLNNFQEIFHPTRCYLSLPVY